MLFRKEKPSSPDAGIKAPDAVAPLIIIAVFGVWAGFPNDLISIPLFILLWPLALCFLGIKATGRERAFYYGWLASFGGAVAALYWLCFPVRDVGALPWPLAIVCALIICACLSLQGGFFSLVARYCGIRTKSSVIILALSWYLLEYVFAVITGFPWLVISGALASWPFTLQTAEFFGAYLSSALWLMGVLFIVSGYIRDGGRSSTGFFGRQEIYGYLIIFFICAYGVYGLGKKDSGEELDVLYIEGNIDQNQKWNPAFQEASLNKYVELTRKGAAYARENGADKLLLIWPETAMPFFFFFFEKYARKVIRAAEETDAPLIFGAPGIAYKKGLPDEAVYNRAFLISPRGRVEGWYDKVHLVPFGEYLPRWLNFKFLDALLQGVGVYQEGESAEPLRYDSLALGMLICYEGVFPELARERVAAGANALVDISNDGWFRRSPAARQHLYLAAPRCIEQNRWLFRGTNNGFSATINNRGEVVTLGRQFEDGWLLSGGKLLKKRSVFYYIEPWEPFVAAFLLIIATSVRARSRKEEI